MWRAEKRQHVGGTLQITVQPCVTQAREMRKGGCFATWGGVRSGDIGKMNTVLYEGFPRSGWVIVQRTGRAVIQ
jgi:hypothetical protein